MNCYREQLTRFLRWLGLALGILALLILLVSVSADLRGRGFSISSLGDTAVQLPAFTMRSLGVAYSVARRAPGWLPSLATSVVSPLVHQLDWRALLLPLFIIFLINHALGLLESVLKLLLLLALCVAALVPLSLSDCVTNSYRANMPPAVAATYYPDYLGQRYHQLMMLPRQHAVIVILIGLFLVLLRLMRRRQPEVVPFVEMWTS